MHCLKALAFHPSYCTLDRQVHSVVYVVLYGGTLGDIMWQQMHSLGAGIISAEIKLKIKVEPEYKEMFKKT